MNYIWNKTYEKQAESQNLFYRYVTTINSINVALYLYATPCLLKYGEKRIIHNSIFINDKTNYTLKKYFREINDDVIELCKRLVISNENFGGTTFNEYYCVEKIPTFIPLTFGDYSCVD